MTESKDALTDEGLPGIWRDADAASQVGQRRTVVLIASKVGGGFVASAGGVFSLHLGQVDLAAWLVLVGFGVAFLSEVGSWILKPEATWYNSRAVAESAKTLAWRYAVGADPFPASMSAGDAKVEFTTRMSSVADQVSMEFAFGADEPITTHQMDALRARPFAERRSAYVSGRTLEQHSWYVDKAKDNQRLASTWRLLLVTVEVLALVLASGRVFGGWQIDFAGLLAAMVAGGAAWIAVKQFSPLASAYAVAANELAFQVEKLRTAPEENWPLIAADAEEAISREHTTWAASRIGGFRGRR